MKKIFTDKKKEGLESQVRPRDQLSPPSEHPHLGVGQNVCIGCLKSWKGQYQQARQGGTPESKVTTKTGDNLPCSNLHSA